MDHYISGDWLVRSGSEDSFVARWLHFTGWVQMYAPGVRSFILMKDDHDPRHFVSLGTWVEDSTLAQWRRNPEFTRRLVACRNLCERFYSSEYTVAASPSLARIG